MPTPAQLGAIPVVGDERGRWSAWTRSRAGHGQAAGPHPADDRQRVIEVTANVTGRSLGDVTRDVRAGTDQMPIPEGYPISTRARSSSRRRRSRTLSRGAVLSVMLVYMLMVALYESWLTPFAIMFSLPVALVGAFLGLYLTGNTFNIFSLIGMIMLMGLVGKNAILLVDFTDTLRGRAWSGPRRSSKPASPACDRS